MKVENERKPIPPNTGPSRRRRGRQTVVKNEKIVIKEKMKNLISQKNFRMRREGRRKQRATFSAEKREKVRKIR